MLIRGVVGVVFTLLMSCSTYQQAIRHAEVVKACEATCSERLKTCSKTCLNHCQHCTTLANAEAAVHFNHYKHQQCVQGEIVALELQSYRDPLQCRKTTCACTADYGVCMQSCNGKIRKRLQVVTACDTGPQHDG